MTQGPRHFGMRSRAVESVHSGMLLFGYALVLAFFMAGVIFLNGS
ncbi:hypothetical protein [Halostagnicola sp. A-GB9-2]|nr:hypothetical protein [Halostagnicola sp. A-GB9-2]MDJ1432167.1 hypothetical protein [Halostagnicola sp. A-GB9-2]